MDEFEALRAIRSKQAELVAKKRGTLTERRRRKGEVPRALDHQSFFYWSDVMRQTLRENLRILHLAACFLRGTPYFSVEGRVNIKPIGALVSNKLREFGYEPATGEVYSWLHSQEKAP